MARIRFDFGALTLDAELLDTPTAKAIAAALPLSSSVLTWGEEVYFDVPVEVARVRLARDLHRHVEIDLLAPGQHGRRKRQRRRNRLGGGRIEQFGVERERAEIETDAGHADSCWLLDCTGPGNSAFS